jgi:hypothetical protein
MQHATVRRHVIALALGGFLITPDAWAAGSRRQEPTASKPPAILSAQTRLAGIWERLGAFLEVGSHLDPFGGAAHLAASETAPADSSDESDVGAHLDPFGRQ